MSIAKLLYKEAIHYILYFIVFVWARLYLSF